MTGALSSGRNHNLRVMSTPEWPVPYYQRAFRHPSQVESIKGNLGHVEQAISDFDVIEAKEAMKDDGHGYIVESIEHHYKIDNFFLEFTDCSQFCLAYVDDMLDSLGIAHE